MDALPIIICKCYSFNLAANSVYLKSNAKANTIIWKDVCWFKKIYEFYLKINEANSVQKVLVQADVKYLLGCEYNTQL